MRLGGIVGTCEVLESHGGEMMTDRCLEESRKRSLALVGISNSINVRIRKMCLNLDAFFFHGFVLS